MQELNEELNKNSNCLSFRLLQMKFNSRIEELNKNSFIAA
jgi:hypothetical protein